MPSTNFDNQEAAYLPNTTVERDSQQAALVGSLRFASAAPHFHVRAFAKMKKLILVALVVFGGMKAYEHFQPNFSHAKNDSSLSPIVGDANTQPNRISASFNCDGRTHCSQMTSCEEATFFLKNCPNTKMDGNHDGVPCEKQWCRL